jgi:hypothetical protein
MLVGTYTSFESDKTAPLIVTRCEMPTDPILPPIFPNIESDNTGEGSFQASCNWAIIDRTPLEDTAQNLSPSPIDPQCNSPIKFALGANSVA